MEKNLRKKVWTVNANDVEWVECKHVNKTGSIIQLETNTNDLTYQLELTKTDTTALITIEMGRVNKG